VGRIRYIKPEFFFDIDLDGLGSLAQLLFIGLWTMADRDGRLEDSPKAIRATIFPYHPERDADVLLAELSVKFISRYSVAGKAYIQISNFAKHQRPHPKEMSRGFPGPDAEGAVKLHGKKRKEIKHQEPSGKVAGPSPFNGDGDGDGDGDSNSRSGKAASEEGVSLSIALRDLIRANDDKARVPADLTSWARDADRLMNLDKRPAEEIRRVMAWALADDFWRGNILSMSKLRKQYGQLKVKMEAPSGSQKGRIVGHAAPIPGKYARLGKC